MTVESLLQEVAELVQKNENELDKTGARFNMFSICGVNHYENTHSAILTELLNPKGSHAMRSIFLDEFIKATLNDENFPIDTKKATVRTEVSMSDGRMDILIYDGNHAICIENKVYASDQWEQLKRYQSYLEKNYKGKWKLLYLTLGGYNASEQSGKGVEYIPVSYSETIVNWLDECIKLSEKSKKTIVCETIKQYQNHIRKLTGASLEEYEMNEVVKAITKNKNSLQGAFEIANLINSGEVRKFIVMPLVNELKIFIKEVLKRRCVKEAICFNQNARWSYFEFWEEDWDFSIRFEYKDINCTKMWCGIWGSSISEKNIPTGYKKCSDKNIKKDVFEIWDESTWFELIDNDMELQRVGDLCKNEIKLMYPKILEYINLKGI